MVMNDVRDEGTELGKGEVHGSPGPRRVAVPNMLIWMEVNLLK